MRTIRIARLLLGIGWEDLARRAGVSRRELRRIELGAVMPTATILAKLDAAFVALLHERARRAAA